MANEIGKGTLCTFHTALTLIQMNKLTRFEAKNSNGRGKKIVSSLRFHLLVRFL